MTDVQGTTRRSGGALTVLIVDDNVDSAQITAMLLEFEGHTVEVAHDGLEALEAAARFKPRVVLLDLGLPKLDGYEVARRLRADPQQRDVFLVALTGYGQDDDRERSKAAGFDRHLVKPVDPKHLSELLASIR